MTFSETEEQAAKLKHSNIWAEIPCRFGYAGVAIFGGLLILILIGLCTGLRRASPALKAPIAFSGVIVAFYIHRDWFS